MGVTRRKLVGGAGLTGAAAATYKFWPGRERQRAKLDSKRGDRPNILMIVTDQERHSSLLPSGLHLPQRERLFEAATSFSNFQNVTALCSMARANIYTGQHYQFTGVYENVPAPMGQDLYPWVPTIGTMLQDAGYETAYFGKWHLTHVPWLTDVGHAKMRALFASYGFEVSDQSREIEGARGGYKHDAATTAATLRFLSDRKPAERKQEERPWFAAVNFVNPHDIMYFLATERQNETFIYHPVLGEAIIEAPSDPLYSEDLKLGLPESFGAEGDSNKPEAHALYKNVTDLLLGRIPGDDIDAWMRHENYYLNCLRDVDRQIGLVLDGLEATGQLDDTIVVFTSDHGELSGAHGLRAKGNTIYRETSSLPFAIRHPDFTGGYVEALASQIDIVPTLLSFAGVTEDDRAHFFPALKGADLSKAMGAGAPSGVTAAGREAVLYQWDSQIFSSPRMFEVGARAYEHSGLRRAFGMMDTALLEPLYQCTSLRGCYDGRYKFARYFRPLDHHLPRSWAELTELNELEAYDTERDPRERINIAYDPAFRDEVWRMALLTNALITREIGEDVGQMLPGPQALWTT